MNESSPILQKFRSLIHWILEGETEPALDETRMLLNAGVSPEDIVVNGLEKAMEALDEKCTITQFNLLEIMLAGRVVNAILGQLYPAGESAELPHRATVILASLIGDVHDLGKNLVRTILRARGFRVVDLGKNVSTEELVRACQKEKPFAVGVSGLLTLVIPQVKGLRAALREAGLSDVLLLAGGAALRQATPEMLHVDFVAETVFDGVRYLEEAEARHRATDAPVPQTKSRTTALENLLRVLRFERTSRHAVVPQLFGHTARLNGVKLLDYRRNGEILASCQKAAREAYGHDGVFAVADLNVEAEALGAVLQEPEDSYAEIAVHPLTSPRDVEKLRIPDPKKAGRMPELLTAIRLLAEVYQGKYAVIGGVVGPVSLAAQLLGLENFLYLLHDAPRQMEPVLDFCTATAVAYGREQLQAGANAMLVIEPTASPDVIPPEAFRRFSLPCLRKIFSAFSSAGCGVNWLFVTGPVLPILQDFPLTGANLVNLDYCVPPGVARATLPKMAFNGNLLPLAFVEYTPSQIAHEVQILRELVHPAEGWIFSAGCEIPPEAKPQNVAAFVQELQQT